jgi:hypothetical protein
VWFSFSCGVFVRLLSSQLFGQLLIVATARSGRLGQGIVATENLGALDAPDDDPFGAGVVEDRDAAADLAAVCGVCFHCGVSCGPLRICRQPINHVPICPQVFSVKMKIVSKG